MDYKQKLNELLLTCAKQEASDLHIAVGRHPTLRIDGALVPLTSDPILMPQDVEQLIASFLSEQQQGELSLRRQVDFSYAYEDKARFRVNAYYQRGYMAAALRLIPAKVRTLEELRMPPILHDFTSLSQGFVLIVGPAGHGKSTTLAALLDEINHNRTEHIITVEDPIEYIFVQDKSIVSQREVKSDTPDFSQALRSILRQDPDVIMIGEMRDTESIATALTAAETGHLVFSTLHTNSAAQTVDRIIDSFPSEQQAQVSSQLAATLVGIVSERLIPRVEGGRAPACEIMIANPAIRNLIRERKTYQIDLVIETNAQEGMVTLNRSLADLVRQREISLENAETYSLNPSELRILLEK
ncbi:MAG: twitching motility protein [Candidatus Wolfebacteria bacterium GW2011_GWC1_43_10]|uniref:Twitching motility protein n=2 Tax=Candidatus Wolfeibacteriota TaxID=1752735 RepID=A0A0G1F754_9BACT|nr:MAG: twitching motility protein [Candidatus Wolfebacteria bacterium GW2011_GWC1_43_10]KKT22520.1 MAG: twitching motility protein [Parcubacteria group bacterium GW2011_GWB1_43_8b]OGM90077.1 MAG: type IV pili twitching motility protein PilT [Candidatus Wolfebacteria bacterium GWA1_42_9]